MLCPVLAQPPGLPGESVLRHRALEDRLLCPFSLRFSSRSWDLQRSLKSVLGAARCHISPLVQDSNLASVSQAPQIAICPVLARSGPDTGLGLAGVPAWTAHSSRGRGCAHPPISHLRRLTLKECCSISPSKPLGSPASSPHSIIHLTHN